MRDPTSYVSSLVDLASASPEERKALWRQAMAALSRAGAEEGPGPLDGLHPDVLVKAVRAALEAGFVDDLDWLSPQAAGIALYSVAAALPVGREQRELGRRVLSRMLSANAATFTAIATIMAQTGGKGLASPAMHARVALVCELPLSHGVADGPLALALVNRREAARQWVAAPSTRSLPARRLAAKILERAAREAARRAQMGDPHAFRVFAGDAVKAAFDRLLADRESLVWRYVATARGLAAEWVPELKKEMLGGLGPGLSPTEWRRSAASLAAWAAVNPEDAIHSLKDAMKRGLFTGDDPGAAGAFVWGLPRAIEAEPETASKMLEAILSVASGEVAEAVSDLPFEYGQSDVGDRARGRALEILNSSSSKPRGGDDGADSLYSELVRDLEGKREYQPLRVQAAEALDAFARDGAAAAYARARLVLTAAQGGLDALESVAKDDDHAGHLGHLARRTSMAVLRDLDSALLERSIVSGILKLGGSAEQARGAEDQLDAIRERLAEWIVARETPEVDADPAVTPRHATLRVRRLRALLHLLDGDLGDAGEGGARADGERLRRLRALWLRTVQAVLRHVERDPSKVLRRMLLATLARAVDAIVRLGVCDVADALLVLSQRIRTTGDFETLSEASMDPDLCHVLRRYAKFLRDTEPKLTIQAEARDSLPPPSAEDAAPEARFADRLRALEELASELAPEPSPRSEALRSSLMRLHGTISAMTRAGALRGLSSTGSSEPDVVVALETWIGTVSQMIDAARGRLDPDALPLSVSLAPSKALGVAVSRILAGVDAALTPAVLGPAIQDLVKPLPHGIGRIVSAALWSLADLPIELRTSSAEGVGMAEQLPPWLPARRTIGGFYVVRALGLGGTASVFVVNRVEDRHDPQAERFALKVPEYNATAARSVSEQEFFELFREEASALIMLPNHENLAKFVTFDLAARPLPILVMELVEGVTLERVIETHAFDRARCLKVMDDVLGGLEAMHAAGIGHLDLKPSNVLLRRGEQGVLVDFGLSGRKLRPGCGTGPYGAPEVWGVLPEGLAPSPPAADIYSFGCLAFEMLTGKVLFEATSEVAQIAMHLSHDGFPVPMRHLMANPEIAPLAEVLVPTLRRDPRHRPTAAQLRREIRAVASAVSGARWPTGAG